jgi:hypothetical protein
VYLLRGWIGIFSTGIDNLTAKMNESGVRAHVFQDDQWKSLANAIRKEYRGKQGYEPLVLVGHSYGADDVVRIAREVKKDNITVDLLVTLDPVTPPKIPGNVKTAVNLYQSNGVFDAMPVLRGVKVSPDDPPPGKIVQWDIRKERQELLEEGTDHFNIEKKGKIHDEVVKHVLAACPPRSQWAAAKRANTSGTVRTALNPPSMATGSANEKPLTVGHTGGGDVPSDRQK